MRVRYRFGALATLLLLSNGTASVAKKKHADDPDSYLVCLQQGMAAAPQDDPSSARAKVLADCLLTRRGVATVTMALLILGGEKDKRAGAETDAMIAADDEKALGISREDDATLFGVYETLEKELLQSKAEYRIHPDGQVECVLTVSSGDPEVDATRCKLPQGCPPLDGRAGADNKAAFTCMATDQRKQLLVLAINRAGLASLSAKDVSSAPS